MNNVNAIFESAWTANAGRKGVAYDWQSLMTIDAVAAIETELRELVLESAE